jgi:type II secretory pathway component GspD/PulD (secretin)
MRIFIQFTVFLIITLNFCPEINIRIWAASEPLELNENKLSIQARKITMRELLKKLSDMTGIEFIFNKSLENKKISLYLKSLDLSDGIRRIIHPLSYSIIYDVSGKVKKVYVLDKSIDSQSNHRNINTTSNEDYAFDHTINPEIEFDLGEFMTEQKDEKLIQPPYMEDHKVFFPDDIIR